VASGSGKDADVAVVGGGVVGCAVAEALASRGAAVAVLEAEKALGLAASGTNSGILHTGFDSVPGELETRLILRSNELREPWLRRVGSLGVSTIECGAELRPSDAAEGAIVAEIARGAGRNRVEVALRAGGVLEIPDEAVTDPVAYTLALSHAAEAAGAEVRTGARVEAIERDRGGLTLSHTDGTRLRCRVAVNCAGLYADQVARLAGDDSFEIYPRKGEFFVFEPPGGEPLDRILLPVPTKRTKGVLVFPTVDGKVVAGPTAHDQTDKGDWSVRPGAAEEVLPKARGMFPALEGVEPIASYAGLRPAGRGVNYAIGASTRCPGLINVAAIRSTGLSASLGIGEHVAALVADQGIEVGARNDGDPLEAVSYEGPWWMRTAREKAPA
jgi:glycerol-3-phosphate dehydrogenase